jgi:hypothetical protein
VPYRRLPKIASQPSLLSRLTTQARSADLQSSLLYGEIVEYSPTLNETLVCLGICAFGLLCYTIFLRMAVPVVNYGEFASADDAETFGAAALGLSKDDYYQAVCALADELADET